MATEYKEDIELTSSEPHGIVREVWGSEQLPAAGSTVAPLQQQHMDNGTIAAAAGGHTVDNLILTGEDERALGMHSIQDITDPPEALRDDDDDDDTLPEYKAVTVPDALIADFTMADPVALFEARKRLSKVPIIDNFNDLGANIPRDNTNLAPTTSDVIEKVNDYDYEASAPGEVCGKICCVATCGIYHYFWRRRTVTQQNYGVLNVSGQTRLVKSGHYTPISFSESWVRHDLPKDVEGEPIRRIGSSKIQLTVREGCIGGANRINAKSDSKDGDYVIFGQGRHILKDEDYQNVAQVQLNDEGGMVRIGPLTILYVIEGFIGGALERRTGRYKWFKPGPPYILHNKHFKDIVCVDRRGADEFNVGPIHFMNVRDGHLGGAYHTKSGYFQILPPGRTYKLHTKDYHGWAIQPLQDKYKLGPYWLLTVRRGFRAGAYRKKGGKFIIFPPGTTYQCNENDYHDPEHVPDDGHHVVCGPYTYLTVRDGTYNGAWRKDTGTFEEFTEAGKLYELHQKDYRNVVSVPIISDEPQTFGPYTCIRITDGHSGIVRKAGKLEVLPSGPHKLGPEYEILESVPLQTFTHEISNLKFNAKDSPVMAVFATISYKVNDAKQVAIRDGGFGAVQQALKYQSELILQTKCSTFNRDELLPTKSDIMVDQKNGERSEDKEDYDDTDRLKEIYEENEREKHERYEDIANALSEKLTLSAANGAWGVDIMNVTLRGFYLLDDKIKANLEKITRDVMDTKAQRVQAALEIEKAKTDKEKRVKQAEADAFVAQKEAEAKAKVAKQTALANAEVAKQEALAHAEVKRTTAKADAEARIETATADNKAKVIIEKAKAEADAESRKIKLDIANKEKEETARADAKAIELMANAKFLQAQKEHEASGLVPEHEIRLRELEHYVKAVEHNAGAAWINPHPLGASLKRVEEFVGMSVPQMLNPNVHTRVVVEGRESKGDEEMETAPLLSPSSTRKVKKHAT